MDFSGNWKVSHNMVKKIFSDIIVTSFFDNEGNLNIWTVNDKLQDFNCTVILELYSFDQTTSKPKNSHETLQTDLKGGSSKAICTLNTSELFSSDCPKDNCFIKISLKNSGDH